MTEQETRAARRFWCGTSVALLLIWGALVGIFWWVVLGIAFAALLHLIITKSDMKRLRRNELIARCDQQHQWILEGDERGIYGETDTPTTDVLYDIALRRFV